MHKYIILFWDIPQGVLKLFQMSTIHDQRYVKLITELREVRKVKNITQEQLAAKLNKPQSYVAKIEQLERRLDVIELTDWLGAIGADLEYFLKSIGFIQERLD